MLDVSSLELQRKTDEWVSLYPYLFISWYVSSSLHFHSNMHKVEISDMCLNLMMMKKKVWMDCLRGKYRFITLFSYQKVIDNRKEPLDSRGFLRCNVHIYGCRDALSNLSRILSLLHIHFCRLLDSWYDTMAIPRCIM